MNVTTWFMVLAMIHTGVPALAEQAVDRSEELRNEAFLRGGIAIKEAMDHRVDQPVVSKSLLASSIADAVSELSEPPTIQEPAEPGKGRSKLLWVGIAIGVAVSAYLIQRSVTKHRRIFAPGL